MYGLFLVKDCIVKYLDKLRFSKSRMGVKCEGAPRALWTLCWLEDPEGANTAVHVRDCVYVAHSSSFVRYSTRQL